MAEEKKDDVAAPAEAAGPKKIMGFPLPQFIFIAVNLLVMLGGLGLVVQISLLYKKPAITDHQVVEEVTKKAEKKIETGDGFFVENYLETTINLRTTQGGRNHYAVVEISLVCGTEDCIRQLKENRAKIEDAFQQVISSKSYNELNTLEIKFRVKNEISKIVNSFLKNTAITDVLFVSFVVQ